MLTSLPLRSEGCDIAGVNWEEWVSGGARQVFPLFSPLYLHFWLAQEREWRGAAGPWWLAFMRQHSDFRFWTVNTSWISCLSNTSVVSNKSRPIWDWVDRPSSPKVWGHLTLYLRQSNPGGHLQKANLVLSFHSKTDRSKPFDDPCFWVFNPQQGHMVRSSWHIWFEFAALDIFLKQNYSNISFFMQFGAKLSAKKLLKVLKC